MESKWPHGEPGRSLRQISRWSVISFPSLEEVIRQSAPLDGFLSQPLDWSIEIDQLNLVERGLRPCRAVQPPIGPVVSG